MKIGFLFIFLIITTSLFASSFWEFSGAVGEVNPFVARGRESGVFSTYFNPAAISFSKKGEQLGLIHITHSTNINLHDKAESSNITEEIFNARRKTSTGDAPLIYRPLPTNMLAEREGIESTDNITFLSFGLVREIIKNRVTFGFLALLPIKNMQVQTPFFNDEREQYFSNSLHFELYNDRFQSFSLSFALSLKIYLKLDLQHRFSTQTGVTI